MGGDEAKDICGGSSNVEELWALTHVLKFNFIIKDRKEFVGGEGGGGLSLQTKGYSQKSKSKQYVAKQLNT